MPEYKNPKPTVDLVILMNHTDGFDKPADDEKIILIKRKNPPYGWALPGGFVNEGESFEDAALREGKEETDLDLQLVDQFWTYSDPKRDPRQHNTSTVFIALPTEETPVPVAMDDAAEIKIVTLLEAIDNVELAFDHRDILIDIHSYLEDGTRPELP